MILFLFSCGGISINSPRTNHATILNNNVHISILESFCSIIDVIVKYLRALRKM